MSPKKTKQSPEQHPIKETRKAALKQDIGRRMREVRKSLGYTQDQMVDYFDCGRANYSRIEKGEVFPNPTMLEVLNQRFHVSLHWLICNTGGMYLSQQPEHPEPVDRDVPIAGGEIRELLSYVNAVPMVRHAVLGFFLEYLEENKKLIAPLMGRRKQARGKG